MPSHELPEEPDNSLITQINGVGMPFEPSFELTEIPLPELTAITHNAALDVLNRMRSGGYVSPEEIETIESKAMVLWRSTLLENTKRECDREFALDASLSNAHKTAAFLSGNEDCIYAVVLRSDKDEHYATHPYCATPITAALLPEKNYSIVAIYQKGERVFPPQDNN